MSDTPSKAAMRAAKIIMNGKKKLDTEYGEKTQIGIADLIDRETLVKEAFESLSLMERAGHMLMALHNDSTDYDVERAEAEFAKAREAADRLRALVRSLGRKHMEGE